MNEEEAKSIVQAGISAGLIKTGPVIQTESQMPPAAPVPPPVDVEVTAEKPEEMEGCQVELIRWAKGKIASLEADFRELNEAYEVAVKQKWKSSTLKRHRDKAGALIVYYNKMLGAFEAGYVLVPNMPGAVFTVRTDEVCPDGKWKYYHYQASKNEGAGLPAGEGEYVSAANDVREHRDTDHEGKVVSTRYCATEFADLEFPFSMSKPRIMEATTRAMALKLFDEFMILPAELGPKPGRTTAVTRQDPIILGTIISRHSTYATQRVSFMIAWHIDTKSL